MLRDVVGGSDEAHRLSWLQFAVETETDSDGERIRRIYTFGRSLEEATWDLVKYEEYRTDDQNAFFGGGDRALEGEWRRTRSLTLEDGDISTVDVPDAVIDDLRSLLDTEITLDTR